ncbi:MAG: hypothetical protein NUW37_02210 [Planctomycetes bacterium]|nr:hypothetical protein [Planctomycetota bacterium]
MSTTETINIEVTPDFHKQLVEQAARLNLTLGAYILYLHERLSPNCDSERLDRHMREVFGKHGDLIRRLAK